MNGKGPVSWLISRKQSQLALQQQGIFTIQQLAELKPEQLARIPGIGTKTAQRLQAQARAVVQNSPYGFNPPNPDRLAPGLFLDIRVDPDTNPQWPWGFCCYPLDGHPLYICIHPDREAYEIEIDEGQVTFVPTLNAAWHILATYINSQKKPVYYWGKVIRRHINQTAPTDAQAVLQAYEVDLHPVFLDAVALPIKSSGLQPVAKYLEFRWQGVTAPYEAHIPYLMWLENNRPDLLRKACSFMMQNVKAVEHIWHRLRNQ